MYQQFRTHLKHTLFTSLIPFPLYALISLSEYLLRLSLSNSDPPNTFENISFNQDDYDGPQLLALLIEAKTIILNGYSSFFSFFVMMTLINIIHLAGCLLTSKSEKNKFDSLHDIWNSPSLKKISAIEKGARCQRIIQRVIFYAIFYYCLTFAASVISSPLADPPTEPVSLLSTLPIMTHNYERLLEEEQENSELYSNNDLSDVRRLSIGKVLSSLRLNPIEVVLSKDNKLAFTILRYYGTLKVIDISDDQNPIIIGSLENLAPVENAYYDFKKLALSADGKTLFATNVQYLEIIDVSDPQIPTLITTLEDPVLAFKAGAEIGVPKFCVPTIALSSDETTFYVASVGLQIFNVTNISNPQVLYAYVSPERPRYNRKMTSLALFPDSKTLLYGNGTLDFYDVSDPANPKLFSSYSNPDLFINSIRLSKNLKKVYAVGITPDETKAILEEIDISQRTSLSRYVIAISKANRFHYPSIIALSPNETNIFVMWGWLFTIKNSDVEMIGFDLTKKQIMTQSKTLFTGAKIFLMVPGTNNIITDSNSQFQIVKLFKDYPNTINFCLANNSQGNFTFPSKKRLVEPSPDSNFLFTLSQEGIFETYNFTSPLQLLDSFNPLECGRKI